MHAHQQRNIQGKQYQNKNAQQRCNSIRISRSSDKDIDQKQISQFQNRLIRTFDGVIMNNNKHASENFSINDIIQFSKDVILAYGSYHADYIEESIGVILKIDDNTKGYVFKIISKNYNIPNISNVSRIFYMHNVNQYVIICNNSLKTHILTTTDFETLEHQSEIQVQMIQFAQSKNSIVAIDADNNIYITNDGREFYIYHNLEFEKIVKLYYLEQVGCVIVDYNNGIYNIMRTHDFETYDKLPVELTSFTEIVRFNDKYHIIKPNTDTCFDFDIDFNVVQNSNKYYFEHFCNATDVYVCGKFSYVTYRSSPGYAELDGENNVGYASVILVYNDDSVDICNNYLTDFEMNIRNIKNVKNKMYVMGDGFFMVSTKK